MKSIEERYRNDVTFHALVDMLYNFLVSNKEGSISELRDAVFVAALKWETEHVRPVPVVVQKWFNGIGEG